MRSTAKLVSRQWFRRLMLISFSIVLVTSVLCAVYTISIISNSDLQMNDSMHYDEKEINIEDPPTSGAKTQDNMTVSHYINSNSNSNSNSNNLSNHIQKTRKYNSTHDQHYEPSVININQLKCGESIPDDAISAFLPPLFEMVYGYTKGRRNYMGHVSYMGSMKDGIKRLIHMQVCSYTLLDKFWDLAAEYNITRWSAHGGSLMGAMCHRSINPWDDDIDITISSCEPLEQIFANATSVAEKYPDMGVAQYTAAGWEGRLIDDDYILIRGPGKRPKSNWFKLKSVRQILKYPTRDLGGMDIMCFDERISLSERGAMKSSGFRDACK
jgi:hypothetical protein